MLLWFFRSLLRLDALSMLDMNMKGTFAPSIEAFETLTLYELQMQTFEHICRMHTVYNSIST